VKARHSRTIDPISLFEKREELRRVLDSKQFANAPRRSRFLEFVAEQTLLGSGEKLNEYLIGVEVYERGPDFDPQQDPIVRVQAHEIRRALKTYYDAEGETSSLHIELPLGHYVPVFSRSHPEDAPEPLSSDEALAAPSSRKIKSLYAVILVLTAICLVLTTLLWLREPSGRGGVSRSTTSLARLPK
jgi:hypothetical protein